MHRPMRTKISCIKTQTLPNSRIPDTFDDDVDPTTPLAMETMAMGGLLLGAVSAAAAAVAAALV